MNRTKRWMGMLLAVLSLTLTGCDYIQPNPENLLRPPEMTDEQTEIYEALESGIGEVRFKYPQTGNNRSAFLFADIDSDGLEEALAFYEDPTGEDEMEASVRVHILDNVEGKWRSVGDFAGYGINIHKVDIAQISAANSCEVVFSWEQSSRRDNVITVMQYNGEDGYRMRVVYEDYASTYEVVNLDGDFTDELMILDINQDEPMASMLGKADDGSLQILSSVRLHADIGEITGLMQGKISEEQTALFIEEKQAKGEYTTEILITNEEGQLENLIYQPETYNHLSKTVRAIPMDCEDIDGDGVVEIPYTTPLPGYVEEEIDQEEMLYLTNWQQFEEGELTLEMSCVLNSAQRYYFIFPEEWIGKVTVYQQAATNEWSFVYYAGALQDNAANVIMRVKVYGNNDIRDQFDEESYRFVGKKDDREYYVYITPEEEISQGELSITLEQFREHFVIL